MVFVLGFLIAAAIGVTGVGGGIITAPALMLFLGVPPVQAVTVALLFAAAVKFLIAPAYLWRRQVDFRILVRLLAGGVPGVLLGSLLLERWNASRYSAAITTVLGISIALTAALNLWRLRAAPVATSSARDRSRWLPLLALPIGAEVGFSSAGAGALGTLLLMGLTPLGAAAVVATDIWFGLVLSLIGGGVHWSFAHSVPGILWPLLAGGIFGAFAGVAFASVLPARAMRAVLCLWLILVGLHLTFGGTRHLNSPPRRRDAEKTAQTSASRRLGGELIVFAP
jgi:uncharacterized membrane protein YfcA